MALTDIQKSIRDKAKAEVDAIANRSTEELDRVRKEWDDLIGSERERLLKSMTGRAEAKLSQAKFKINERVNSEVLKAKQTQLDKVFDTLKDDLAGMENKAYETILTKLLAPLKGKEGTLSTSADKTKSLEAAAKKAGVKAKIDKEPIETIGGFIFHGEEVDLDSTFETILEKLREESLIEVHQVLFTESE